MVNNIEKLTELDVELSLPEWQQFFSKRIERGMESLIRISDENKTNLEIYISGDNLNNIITDFSLPYKSGQTFNKNLLYYTQIYERSRSYTHGLENIFSIKFSNPKNEIENLIKETSIKIIETYDSLRCFYKTNQRWKKAEPVFIKLMDKILK